MRGELEGRDFLRSFLALHGMDMDEKEEEVVQGGDRDQEVEENVSGYFKSALQSDEQGEIGERPEKTDIVSHEELSSSSQGFSTSAKDIGLTLLKLLFVISVVLFLTVRLFTPKHEQRLQFLGGIDFIDKQ